MKNTVTKRGVLSRPCSPSPFAAAWPWALPCPPGQRSLPPSGQRHPPPRRPAPPRRPRPPQPRRSLPAAPALRSVPRPRPARAPRPAAPPARRNPRALGQPLAFRLPFALAHPRGAPVHGHLQMGSFGTATVEVEEGERLSQDQVPELQELPAAHPFWAWFDEDASRWTPWTSPSPRT